MERRKQISTSVILVGTDTDLLVLLVAIASVDQNIYMQFNSEQLYTIKDMQAKLTTFVKSHILIAHAITAWAKRK